MGRLEEGPNRMAVAEVEAVKRLHVKTKQDKSTASTTTTKNDVDGCSKLDTGRGR